MKSPFMTQSFFVYLHLINSQMSHLLIRVLLIISLIQQRNFYTSFQNPQKITLFQDALCFTQIDHKLDNFTTTEYARST